MDRTRSLYWIAPMAAIATLCAAALVAFSSTPALAQRPGTPDSGFAVYFQYCAGCHDQPSLAADKTVPVLRELGEPRVRRSLENVPTAVHGEIGRRIKPERIDLLVAFLSPDNDRSTDCGPPDSKMFIASPQCPDGRTPLPIPPPQ